MVLLELSIFISIYHWFGEQAAWIAEVLHFLSGIIVLSIIKNSRHLSADMIWIVAILLFPIPATAVYIFLGADMIGSRTTWNLVLSTREAKKYYPQDEDTQKDLITQAPELRGQVRYISDSAGFPFYRNTGFDYYGLGDTGYPVMLEEMKKADTIVCFYLAGRGAICAPWHFL